MHNPASWRGNINISPLEEALKEDAILTDFLQSHEIIQGGDNNNIFYIDVDIQFIPVNAREATLPFDEDVVPQAIAILDTSRIPLWLFTEETWAL